MGIEANPVIREIAHSHYERWLTLWQGYNAFYGRAGPTALPAQITQSTWKRFFDPAEPVHALVAELDHTLVGLAHYLFHRSTTMLGPICYLQDLFTSEESRGKGVGRALIQEVCLRARTAGSTRVYWQTHETNQVAQLLYDRVGQRSGFIVYRRDLGVL
jgi:GNAT superfamily N-acetyltransferase